MEPNQKLILASTSPRRASLLASAGIAFCVSPPVADETPLEKEDPTCYAVRTARMKAESIPLSQDAVVLGADTAVALEGQILGKPAGPGEAALMLRSLSGKKHRVITGVCLRSRVKTVCFHTETIVEFRPLTEGEIAAYLATGEPYDKAGAYAIQGGAAGMVRRIDGSCTNVIGLPLCEVIEALEAF